jgi:curved DNA-binding protein CbpA
LKDLSEQTHYEVLELAPGCAIDDLAKAYAQAKDRYGPGALATYALAEPGEAEALLRRVDEAFAVLADPEQRRTYDSARGFSTPGLARAPVPADEIQAAPAIVEAPPPIEVESPPLEVVAAASVPAAPEPAPAPAPEPVAAPVSAPELVAAPVPVPEAAAAPQSVASPETPLEHKPVRKTESDLPVDSAVTGDALRRVREARGLSLKDVEGRTKIGHWHLENIERERYADLPAQVYLRGFLMSFARELKLDPVRVAKSYLEQMKAKSQAKPE